MFLAWLGRRAENRDAHPVAAFSFSERMRSVPALAFRMAAGYCGASARIKFDVEQFAALFNELQARGDKGKLRQLFGS